MRCLAKEAGAARPKESMWIPASGRTGFVIARIQRLVDSSCFGLVIHSGATAGRDDRPATTPAAGRCDTVPVTMPSKIGIGERGVMGAPRSHF